MCTFPHLRFWMHDFYVILARLHKVLHLTWLMCTATGKGSFGSLFTKHFWSFMAKRCCSVLLNNRIWLGPVLKRSKQPRTNKKTFHTARQWVFQFYGSPKVPDLLEKMLFSSFYFIFKVFTVAATLHTPPIKGVNTVFSNTFGISVLSVNWITPDKLSIWLCILGVF